MATPSSSSSIDSNTHSLHFMQSSLQDSDLSTDLKLGLTTFASHNYNHLSLQNLNHRQQCVDWPPIKHLLRSSLGYSQRPQHQEESLYVKVYMEGLPIGRKLNVYSFDGYNALIHSLSLMFTTTILCPEPNRVVNSDKYHILTYEDREGDWMMVGDVPWQMFVKCVKRLKITRADRC